MRKEKEEEEEIKVVWPLCALSLNLSKRKKTSKTGNSCNSCKRSTAHGSAVTSVEVLDLITCIIELVKDDLVFGLVGFRLTIEVFVVCDVCLEDLDFVDIVRQSL